MTRDAEHTPTGYEDAASVGVNQAPAPSSLAGEEAESRALDWMEWVAQGALDTDDVQLSGEEIIQHAEIELASIRKRAALSPEAPAREGGSRGAECKVGPDTKGDCSTRAGCDCPALTPRHEAPADPCASHRSMGFHIDPCCPHCEAPAEGAGEHDPIRSVRTIMARAVERKDQETLDHARIALAALRARSSAPETREGLKPQVRSMEDTLSAFAVMEDHFVGASSRPVTHPAAPSADKLREAVEALEPFANLGVSSGPDDEPCHYAYRITRGAIRNARQALAALKAEG